MDEIDPQKEREDELYDQLLASPLAEVTGIVSPSGVGAGKSRGQDLWSLVLSFDAWRIDGGPIRPESLTVRRRVTDEELRNFQSAIDAEAVVRFAPAFPKRMCLTPCKPFLRGIWGPPAAIWNSKHYWRSCRSQRHLKTTNSESSRSIVVQVGTLRR